MKKINLEDPTALYLQILQDIEDGIKRGDYAPGERLPSQSELCRIYEVSQITAKRAITELKNRNLVYTRVGQGCFVSSREKRLEEVTIGIVLRDITNPFFSLVLGGAEDAASHKGIQLLISNSRNTLEREHDIVMRHLAGGADGIVIASVEHLYRKTDYMRELEARSVPYVLVSYIEDEDVNYVGIDHRKGGILATQYLIEKGYRHIVYVGASSEILPSELRYQGYQQALANAPSPLEPRAIRIQYRLTNWSDYYEHSREIGKQLIRTNDLPEVIFAYNDLIALGLINAFLETGKRVPDDVAVVGFDDIRESAQKVVPLTTVHQPTEEIGRVAIDLLISNLQSGASTPPVRKFLEPRLIVRKSA